MENRASRTSLIQVQNGAVLNSKTDPAPGLEWQIMDNANQPQPNPSSSKRSFSNHRSITKPPDHCSFVSTLGPPILLNAIKNYKSDSGLTREDYIQLDWAFGSLIQSAFEIIDKQSAATEDLHAPAPSTSAITPQPLRPPVNILELPIVIFQCATLRPLRIFVRVLGSKENFYWIRMTNDELTTFTQPEFTVQETPQQPLTTCSKMPVTRDQSRKLWQSDPNASTLTYIKKVRTATCSALPSSLPHIVSKRITSKMDNTKGYKVRDYRDENENEQVSISVVDLHATSKADEREQMKADANRVQVNVRLAKLGEKFNLDAPNGVVSKIHAIRDAGLKELLATRETLEYEYARVVNQVNQDQEDHSNLTNAAESESTFSMSDLVHKFDLMKVKPANAATSSVPVLNDDANNNEEDVFEAEGAFTASTNSTQDEDTGLAESRNMKRKYFSDDGAPENSGSGNEEASMVSDEDDEEPDTSTSAVLELNIQLPPIPKSFDFQNMQMQTQKRPALDLDVESASSNNTLENTVLTVQTEEADQTQSTSCTTPEECLIIPLPPEFRSHKSHSRSKMGASPATLRVGKLNLEDEDDLEIGVTARTFPKSPVVHSAPGSDNTTSFMSANMNETWPDALSSTRNSHWMFQTANELNEYEIETFETIHEGDEEN